MKRTVMTILAIVALALISTSAFAAPNGAPPVSQTLPVNINVAKAAQISFTSASLDATITPDGLGDFAVGANSSSFSLKTNTPVKVTATSNLSTTVLNPLVEYVFTYGSSVAKSVPVNESTGVELTGLVYTKATYGTTSGAFSIAKKSGATWTDWYELLSQAYTGNLILTVAAN
ncbi:MAG: hypothetical protein VB144_09580 [Clostridia bacterium]|nr:hypothetical protein [Clostridia bacterium]